VVNKESEFVATFAWSWCSDSYYNQHCINVSLSPCFPS